ncbi:MAG: hypothetical protein CME29_03540 [Gemmatimonadetes bacterium]|nr:hypothetical protein [Gemmatimonadota bacterium]
MVTSLEEKILELFSHHEEDLEIFIQESIAHYSELINSYFVKESVHSIQGKLQRERNDEDEDADELAESLSKYLVSNFQDEITDALKVFFVDKTLEQLGVILNKILDPGHIKVKFETFFESFSIKDLHFEITELARNKKLKEELELYLYFGEIKYTEKIYPLFFTPMMIEEHVTDNRRSYILKFEKRFFVNKNAIEYVFQELEETNTSAQISSVIGDRICYLEEEDSFADTLNLKVDDLLSHFGLEGDVDFRKGHLNTALNQSLSFNNKLSLALFDKADESSVNDYEELLGKLDDDDDQLGTIFSELISNFIESNPESITTEVLDNWDHMPISDRLVSSSPIPLNEEQRKILDAINNPKGKFITVQGPPGTGKSHTITAILFEAILKNKSILMLSDKKEALDVVEDKLVETLNKTRLGENFQNPILRLGREGNTYSKILRVENVNQIREHYRASKLELSKIEPERIEDDIRRKVSDYVDKYSKIKPETISEYLRLKSSLDVSDDVEHEMVARASDVTLLYESTRSVARMTADDGFRSLAEAYSKTTVDEIQDILKAVDLAFLVRQKYSVTDKLNGLSLEVEMFVKEAIQTYEEQKSRPLAFLFANFQLKDWNLNINKRLDFKEYIDFRKRKNFEWLQQYLSLTREINQKISRMPPSQPSNLNPPKLGELTCQLVTDTDIEIDGDQATDYLKGINAYQSCRDLEWDFLKQYKIKLLENESVFKTDLGQSIRTLESIRDLQYSSKSLVKKFEEIPETNVAREIEQVQNNSIAEMANICDERFITYFENNKTKANTLKRMISKKKKFPREDFTDLSRAFPCIIAGIRDYADYVPLQPEMFDLIIIDEASQVSIAQAFPAILRGKKIVVMGDRKQFSNVKSANASKLLNSNYQASIREAFRKTYGDDDQKYMRSKAFDIKVSILDFFDDISNYDCLLRKHFRGYPEIISFSSKHFYSNKLQAIKIRAKPIEEVIVIKELEHDGLTEKYRNTNKIESDYIVSEIEKLLEKRVTPSVGILTPMRDQQKFILSELEKSKLYHEMGKLNIKVMTFDSCQGEERDIIFYSFVDDPSNDISFRVLGSKFDLSTMDPEQNLRLQRLNVGMSRAKEKIVLVVSKPIEEFRGNALHVLNHYKGEIENAKKEPGPSDTDPKSAMEAKLLAWILASKFYVENKEQIDLLPQFEIGKYLKILDPHYKDRLYCCDFFMTFTDGDEARSLIIEYDGFVEHFVDRENVNEFNYPHYYSEADVEREKTLESYGFPMLRINKFNIGKDPISFVSNQLESFFLSAREIV